MGTQDKLLAGNPRWRWNGMLEYVLLVAELPSYRNFVLVGIIFNLGVESGVSVTW